MLIRVGELGKVVTGKTPPTKQTEYFGEGYPFITPTDISDYNIRYIDSTERYLSQKWADRQPKYLLPTDSICYVCIGSTVGKMCLTKIPSFTNQQINSIVCDSNKTSPHYLFYKLRLGTPQIQSIANGRGSGKSIINKSEFEDLKLEISSLPIQRKIAFILTAYDDLIENNIRRIKILEEMAQTIYNEWFVKFRFSGHSKVRMVKSELGEIPEGWEVRKIFDITTVRYGKNLPRNKMKDDGEYLVYGAAKVIGKYDEYNCEEKVVITGCRGSCGQLKITKPKAFITNNSFIFNFMEEQKLFFYHQLLKRGFQNFIGGTAQPQITLESISSLKLIMPRQELIKAFNQIAVPIFNKINIMDDININLQQTRDILLPRLISGELDVENLDIKVDN